jgi:SnoaL-like polyketide cyclase
VEGTHDKEFRGVPATHKKFETVGISIFHFEGAKIKNAWAVADALTPAIELGVVKTTHPLKPRLNHDFSKGSFCLLIFANY